MEVLPRCKMLEYRPDILQVVRKKINLDEETLNDSLDTLEDWTRKQAHFTKKEFARSYLEIILISKKGSVEKAKRVLDSTLTIRTLIPHLFGDFDVMHDFQDLDAHMSVAVLPKLTKEHYRIFCIKMYGNKMQRNYLIRCAQLIFVLGEYMRANDYIPEYQIIADYSQADLMELIAKTDIMEYKRVMNTYLPSLGLRIKGIHFISSSKMITSILNTFIPLLKSKLAKRLVVHERYELLYDIFEKDILPEDFGGKEKSVDDLWSDWKEVLSSKQHREYMKEVNAARTDEALRPTDQFNDEYMGTPGTFRNLTLD